MLFFSLLAGEGELKQADDSHYTGSFLGDCRDGRGTQIYGYCKRLKVLRTNGAQSPAVTILGRAVATTRSRPIGFVT